MSDASGKTAATSLAVVEKRPQRPGGCVGIFFQLFDWNRRLAKKKLFSKKLLSPVRLKKCSKKFGGDDKLPKHRLIADENSGGFPNMKKSDGTCGVDSEQKHEMRTPGLVARLMGLEAMPAVQRDKLKKASLSVSESNKGVRCADGHSRPGRQDLAAEKGESKHELRPQKLQKTGISERRPVTRFGAEALQLKNVLSRSRKQQQPKLVSPVKSPRNLSGKNASRLIGAATRILEPGLQRSRSKCALTYSDVVHHPPASDNLIKEPTGISLEQLENSNYFICGGASAQSLSCGNCAHLLVEDYKKNTEEQPANFSPLSKNACFSFGQIGGDPRVTIVCPTKEKGKDHETSPIYSSLAMDGGQSRFGHMAESKPLNPGGQRQWQATSPQRRLQRDVCPSVCLKQKGLGQKQTLQERDRILIRPKLNRPQSNRVSAAANATNETRNYIAMNRNLNSHARLTIPAKVDNCQLHADRKTGESRHDSLSPVRKRRSMSIARQNEGCSGFVSSTFLKSTNARSNVMPGKGTNRLLHLQEGRNGDGVKNEAGVVSFTFNSQMKRKTGIHTEVEEKRKQNGANCEIPVKKAALVKNDGKQSSLKSCLINGDSLGALLEQKLKELTCQGEDESTFGETVPKKTTAMILQELISALTTERPFQEDLTCKLKNQKSHFCADDPQADMSNSTGLQSSQVRSKSTKYLAGCLQDCEHQSPGSVLEASFSNDSCASSSLDDGSRHNPCAELTELCNERHSFEPDVELLDSATSLSMGRFYRESVITLMENISEVFSKINHGDVLLKGGKLAHAKEVILNTDMVFGNAARHGGFSISLFVLNELETLASVMAANFSECAGVGFDASKGKELKGFVFDCVIEYLDSRFSRYSNYGFNAWMRLPLRMKTEMLIGDIVEEVGRWAELAGLIPDELIYFEMSRSLGKWIDFELEAFETGAEIEAEILQALTEELVLDLTGFMSSST